LWRLLTADQKVANEAIIHTKKPVSAVSETWDEAVVTELLQNTGNVSGILHIVASDFVFNSKYMPEDEDFLETGEAHVWRKANNDRVVDIFYDWKKRQVFLKIVNKAPDALTQIALAINDNCFGLEMDGGLDLPTVLDFGESFEVGVPLKFVESRIGRMESSTLQMALRVSENVKLFEVPFDLACLTREEVEIGPEQFAMMWQQDLNEIQMEIAEASVPESEFANRSITIVSRDGGILRLAFCLGPSAFYLAMVKSQPTSVLVAVRGNPALFKVIQENARSLFCSY
jgi:hypothetical protein